MTALARTHGYPTWALSYALLGPNVSGSGNATWSTVWRSVYPIPTAAPRPTWAHRCTDPGART